MSQHPPGINLVALGLRTFLVKNHNIKGQAAAETTVQQKSCPHFPHLTHFVTYLLIYLFTYLLTILCGA